MHRVVALVSLVTHLVFVAFAVLGGFLAWLLPWVLLPHIVSALWGARMAVWRPVCPLSRVENWGRVGSGRPPLDDGGFITHYFEGRLYPEAWARRVVMVVGGLVVGSWLGLAVR
ncbi:MAG: DUF2784 domain-containing protein [Nocardioides sp.]